MDEKNSGTVSDAVATTRESIAIQRSMDVTHLSRLPRAVSRRFPAETDAFSPMAVVRTVMSMVFLLLVSGAALLMDWSIVAIFFALLCVAGLVAIYFTAQRYRDGIFGRVDGVDLGVEETQEQLDADERVTKMRVSVGNQLADVDDPVTSMRLATVRRSMRQVVEDNLWDEAERTSSWLSGSPLSEAFERVEARSDDGTRLVGHVRRAEGSNRWLVYLHSYKSGWEEGMLVARTWAEHGYNLLLVEMRGHGESEGAYIGMGVPDRRDVVAWCRRIVETDGEDARIVVAGLGMGAAAACMASDEDDLPHNVRAILADSCYTDAWNGIVSLAHGLTLDAHPVLDLARLILKASKGGYDLLEADVVAHVERTDTPILFTTPAHDTVTPPTMTVLLGRAAREASPEVGHEFATFYRAGHGLTPFGTPKDYWTRVFSFIDPKVD